MADTSARKSIYRLRHDVYAAELGQFESRADGILPDNSNIHGIYITATVGGELAGFISITPPSSPSFSVDKYLPRDQIAITFDERLYEVRALTVKHSLRGYRVAGCLMYAAYRWVEAHGGKRILSVGRRQVLDMYLRIGFIQVGPSFTCGVVEFDLISAEVSDIAAQMKQFGPLLDRMEKYVDWDMGISFRRPLGCYHGGAFFDGVTKSFEPSLLQVRFCERSCIAGDYIQSFEPD